MKKPTILATLCSLLIISTLCAPLHAQTGGGDWKYDNNILPGAAALGEYLPLLKGKKVCLLSNQTGIIPSKSSNYTKNCHKPKFTHIVDTLVAEGVNVVCLMSPEHGFRGTADAGEKVSSAVDSQTGIPVRSLYGATISEEELMSGFDVLLFDLQDVGVRYYTYYITMIKMMARCAKYNIPFILLDRPNPVGFYTDGPILDKKYKSGVGGLPIPVVYGMTIGELAFMANEKGWLEFKDHKNKWLPNKKLRCNLTVIKCQNYTHSSHYKLPIKPSPNLPNMRSVYLYPSTCYFEATDVSLGRGTKAPFQIYGSPLMKGKRSISGKKFSFCFTPKSVAGAKNPPLLGKKCYGIDLRKGLTLSEINRQGVNLEYVIDAYRGCGEQGDEFFKNNFEKEIGNGRVRQMIKAGKSATQIKKRWAKDVERFKKLRAPYMLYE